MAGIEPRYRKTAAGLADYRLSIRERVADLRFAGTEPVEVDRLGKVISDYGYTPRPAIVTARGRLVLRTATDARPALELRGIAVEGEVFLVQPSGPETLAEYQALLSAAERGDIVRVTGTLEPVTGEPRRQRVLRLVGQGSSTEDASPPAASAPAQPQDRTGASLARFTVEHFLEHGVELGLTAEQLTAVSAIEAGLQEKRRGTEELAAHCGSEIREALSRMVSPEDEEFILREAREIAVAEAELLKAEAAALVAAWKQLNLRQRRKWFDIAERVPR
jgi:hypothetical protein